MSRIVVHGLDNRSVGELRGPVDRGWTVIGAPGVKPGGETELILDEISMAKPWLQLGRVVMIDHPRLRPWAGVIDTPWDAVLPGGVALYNAEYLFHLRTPEAPLQLTGTTADVIQAMIDQMNAQEETYLRMGVVDDDTVRQESLDERTYWEQLTALLERSSMEMQIRPVKEEGRLYLYVDVLERIGRDTGYLFHDGKDHNMSVVKATINNQIWNRVVGIGKESTKKGRRRTPPFLSAESAREFRTRSHNVQFDVSEDSTLLNYTSTYVQSMSRPVLTMDVLIEDVGDAVHGYAFENIGEGNTAIFHAHGVCLPGGRKGWKGEARMMAIAYEEKTNTVGMTVEAYL